MLQRRLLRYSISSQIWLRSRHIHQTAVLLSIQHRHDETLRPVTHVNQPHIAAEHAHEQNASAQKPAVREEVHQDPSIGFEDPGLSTKQLLNKAYKDGALQIKPDQIGVFLSELSTGAAGGERLSAQVLRNACAKLNIPIDAAYTLARLLVRSPGPLDRFTGRQILLAASELGSARATVHIVKSAIQTDQLDKEEVKPALAYLHKLSKRNSPEVSILVAQAKVCEREGDYESAARLYKSTIEHVPVVERSLASRAFRKVRDMFEPSNDETVVEQRKITVEDKDPELDVAAAHLALGQLQYDHLGNREAAIENWEVAASEYDDTTAYFCLARHMQIVAREEHAEPPPMDDPVDRAWMRFVPYKWYEYAMKAAVSGHAEAMYNIGLFYLLEPQGLANSIIDAKLRRTLQEDPTMRTPSSLHYRPTSEDHLATQVECIHSWFMCAAKAGCSAGYLLAEFVRTLEGPNRDVHVANILGVADEKDMSGTTLEGVRWSEVDRELARSLKEHFKKTLWFAFKDGEHRSKQTRKEHEDEMKHLQPVGLDIGTSKAEKTAR